MGGLTVSTAAGAALAVLLAAPAAGREIRVAPGELDAALAEAGDGDVLRLAAGVHRGPIVVERRVALVGEPGAVVAGPGAGTVLTLAADGSAARGLTLRGSGADLARDEAVVRIAAAHGVTVEDCRVEARAFGIYLEAGGGHRVAGNHVAGDPSLPIVRRGNGIHLWKTTGNEIVGNRLVGVRDGIYLSFAHDNLLRDNAGSGLRYGIHYMFSERNTLAANRFVRSTGGIALMFSMRNTIVANQASDNRDFGILCQQIEHSRLSGNRAAGNGRGFYIENSAANRFTGNLLAANGVGVYLTAGSEANVFQANRFAGNLVQVYDDRPGRNAFFADGRGNSWSDYAGFDWNGDGVGDTPYRLHTAASALLARRPVARWFWMSPALALLDWWEARLTAPSAGALDPFPLVGSVEAPG